MIINTEVKDLTKNGMPVYDSYGRCKRFLLVSYVGKDRHLKKFMWVIPEEFMYQWKYATRNDTPDPNYRSWDFKPVVKEPIVGNFSEQRIHEMLVDLIMSNPDNPDLQEINELYIPETTYSDIEVDVGETGFPRAEDATNQVNTCSFVRGDEAWCTGLANLSDDDIEWIQKEIDKHVEKLGVKYTFRYRYHENELSLLNDIFFNFIGTSDCVTGWNWFGYDWLYLTNRAKLFGLDISSLSPTKTFATYRPMDAKGKDDNIRVPMHRGMYDYLEVYRKWDKSISPKISNKLDWVAETVLGIKKVAHKLGFRELWRQKPRDYVFYNVIDSILVKEIDKRLKTASTFFGLANLMHTPALTAFSSTKSIEIVDAEYLYKENRVFPKAKTENNVQEYEGAFVYEPIPGVFRQVWTVDYASLYPTTMRQFNISPDTFIKKDKNHRRADDEIVCVNGSVYTRKFKGFIPKILDDFYAKRKSFKKNMTMAAETKYELEEILKRRKSASSIA